MSNNSNLSRLAPRLNADGTYPKTQGFQLITSGSADWTVPAQVTFIKATVVGAGGAGGGVSGTSGTKGPGGGGGGGAWAVFYLNVTPGSLIPYSVGTGGVGNLGANGATGGITTFNGSTVNGGGGGLLYAGSETVNRGDGAINPGLLPSQGYSGPGGNGASGTGNTTQAFGGAGGGSYTSATSTYLARLVPDLLTTPGRGILGGVAAGVVASTSAAPINGTAAPSGYGNGGGGATILTNSASTSNAQGGAGSGGAILIEWY